MSRKTAKELLKVTVYGLDRKGFALPPEAVRLGDRAVILFVRFGDAARLDEPDGAIVAQGIFESIDQARDHYGLPFWEVRVRSDLDIRERQLCNLLDAGGWCCFLVGEIVDMAPHGLGEPLPISNTDLCKRALNRLGVRRSAMKPTVDVKATRPQFDKVIRSWGVAETEFTLPERAGADFHTIASYGNRVVAFEHGASLFFLPFKESGRAAEDAKAVGLAFVDAILSYRQERLADLALWTAEFKFAREAKLEDEIEKRSAELNSLRDELAVWRRWKALLAASGERLREEAIRAVRDFFGLKVDESDEHREDFKILDAGGSPVAFVECRGTTSGVRLEDVNQVDTNRERSRAEPSVSGLLAINCDRSLEGIQQRLERRVGPEQVKRGRSLNVLILRTIDLLFLMRQVEHKPTPEKGRLFLELLGSGGGWLRAGPDGCELVKG